MGFKPMVIITTSDTLVENPEIQEHYRAEHRKMRAFAKAHKFDIRTEIVEPSLLNSMQLKMLTGRGIPSFPAAALTAHKT
ncbi:hypothetical protein [Ottowia sp.]|uniref:hypothetical protein n=1 Tax=Ottowia sp. TaxID=1898956 RepID=UPI0025EE1492|nr:hypothetical protein [Ottowia sp.]